MMPSLAAPGGNSDNAHSCQKGGWQSLARWESPGIAFMDQDECVSYGADGGEIVDLVTYSVSVTYTQTFDPNYCNVFYNLSGFPANSTYTVTGMTREAGEIYEFPWKNVPVTTDASGNASGRWGSYVESDVSSEGDSFVKISVLEERVDSGFVEVACE